MRLLLLLLPNSPTSHRLFFLGWIGRLGQATEFSTPCLARPPEYKEVLRLFTTVNHLLPPRTGGPRDPGSLSLFWGLHKEEGGAAAAGGDDRLDKGVSIVLWCVGAGAGWSASLLLLLLLLLCACQATETCLQQGEIQRWEP